MDQRNTRLVSYTPIPAARSLNERRHRTVTLTTATRVNRPSGSLALLAKKRIEAGYNTRLSLARLAGEFSVSREHLCRVFKRQFQVTVTNYIRGCRIEQALSLIDETNLQLKQIGSTVGYTSYNEFFRAFKRVVCMTPTVYAQDVRSKRLTRV